MTLRYRMRSSTLHLEHFLEVGRQFQIIRSEKKTSGTDYEFENRYSEPSASASSDCRFLDQLDSGQTEHFDWLLINATRRRFKAWGKKAFLLEKIFVIGTRFWKNVRGDATQSIGTENLATARQSTKYPSSCVAATGQFKYHPTTVSCLAALAQFEDSHWLHRLGNSSEIGFIYTHMRNFQAYLLQDLGPYMVSVELNAASLPHATKW